MEDTCSDLEMCFRPVVLTHKLVKRFHAGVFHVSGLTGKEGGVQAGLVCANSRASHSACCFLSSSLAPIDRAAHQRKAASIQPGQESSFFLSLSLRVSPLTIPSSSANAVIQFQLCYTSA